MTNESVARLRTRSTSQLGKQSEPSPTGATDAKPGASAPGEQHHEPSPERATEICAATHWHGPLIPDEPIIPLQAVLP